MKGYECLLLVLVILQFISCSVSLGRPDSHRSGMTSCTREPEGIWLRNACHGGFLTMTKGRKKTKVIAQHRGTNAKSFKVELLKESCHDESAGFLGSVTTRLYSPHAQKYVCFSPQGRVVAKTRKNVDRLGPLCMFLERAVTRDSRHFVQFQSSYNPEWYLGFNGKRIVHKRRTRRLSHSAHTLPRKMKRTRKSSHRRRRRQGKCDFSFSTGSFRSIRKEFSGLIEHIRKQKLIQTHNNDSSLFISSVTANDEILLTSSLSKDSSANELLVPKVRSPAYYYIESNDERYKPNSSQNRNLDESMDDEDRLESQLSFLNFKSNLRSSHSSSTQESRTLNSSKSTQQTQKKSRKNSRRNHKRPSKTQLNP